MLIIDTFMCRVIAQTSDITLDAQKGCVVCQEPEGFTFEHAHDWAWNGETLEYRYGIGLANAIAAEISCIKEQAAQRLTALDWKLERAKERELAGWGSLADVAEVLAQRESIRQSSNAAEAQIAALTTIDEVHDFEWSVDVPVIPPRLVSPTEFARRFTDSELSGVMEAAKAYAPIAAWLERFRASSAIDLDNPSLQAGVTALEIAGLLSNGRAQEILT